MLSVFWAWVEANPGVAAGLVVAGTLGFISIVVSVNSNRIAEESARSNFYTAHQDLLHRRINIRDTDVALGGETWSSVLACRRAKEIAEHARDDQREDFLKNVGLLAKFVLAEAEKSGRVLNNHIVHLRLCCRAVQGFDEVDGDYSDGDGKIRTQFAVYLCLDLSDMTFSEFVKSFQGAINESQKRHRDDEGDWKWKQFERAEFGRAWKAVL